MNAWQERAGELAAWAWERLANRVDVWGGYTEAGGRTTCPAKHSRGKVTLTREHLERHFRGGRIVGLHTTAPANLSKWGAVDIDCHGEGGNNPADNERAALRWYGELCGFGFRPLLVDSNGGGGFHLRVLLREPAPTAHVFGFVRWLTGDYPAFGFPARPECFPKQPEVAPPGENGQYGNWLRLPGRHHKHDHWSRVWDGSRWLEGDDAVGFILSLGGDDPGLLLAQRVEAYRAKLPNLGVGQGRDDVAYNFAAFLSRDLNLSDDVALHWLNRWDAGNAPPKGCDRLREILDNAQRYGRHDFGSGVNRARPSANGTHSRNGAHATTPPPPGGGAKERVGWEVILDYFCSRYQPGFRVRDSIFSGREQREVGRIEACAALPPGLIGLLGEARDAPRLKNKDVDEDKLPAFFRKWAGTAWVAMLDRLPDEDAAEIGSAAGLAAEEFRRLVREALLTPYVVGQDVVVGVRENAHLETKIEKKPLVEWCKRFATSDRWDDIRGLKLWSKAVEKDGQVIVKVALRHEVFSQVKADRRLCEMGATKFTKRCGRYGVGRPGGQGERPHGHWALVLDDEFVADLLGSVDVEDVA